MAPDEIRSLRNRLGLTQIEFGNVLGVSRRTVINWEHGRTEPLRAQRQALQELRNRLREAEEQNQADDFVSDLIVLAGTTAGLLGLIKIIQSFGNGEDT